MTTAVTLFDQQLPAHLQEINDTGNIVVREIAPSLSFRGKTFRVNMADGNGERPLMKANGVEPVQVLPVVILGYNLSRSRAFYPPYVQGQNQAPLCASSDGVKPDEGVSQKQADTCAQCPRSVKGSKITPSGAQTTECSPFRVMISVPAMQPMSVAGGFRTKIPQTSMWDKDMKEYEANGWYAFDQYLAMLKQRGVNHTAAVITKITFDARKEYPKLMFCAHGWVTPEIAAAVKQQLTENKELIERRMNMVDGGPTETEPAPEEFEQPAPAQTTAPAPAAPAVAAAPAPAAAVASRPRPTRPTRGAPAPQPQAAVAPAPATQPAPAAVPSNGNGAAGGTGFDDDGMAGFIPAAQSAPAVAAARPVAQAAAPAQTASPDGIADLLSGWDAPA